MSILKNILKPFVQFNEEEEEDFVAKKSTPTPKAVSPPVDPPVSTRVSTNSPTPIAVASTPTEPGTDYAKHFDELIESANANNPLFQGTDFKEFIDSKVDVESIADEATRYKTAFNVLKRAGLSKERLVSTGQEYINIVNQDLKGFEGAYTQQYKADVEQKQQLLEQKTAELKALNEKINALNADIKSISTELVQNKDRLDANKSAFMQAGEKKRNELEAELEKISRYF